MNNIENILELKDEMCELESELRGLQLEEQEVADRIFDLESELEEIREEISPIKQKIEKIKWNLGINVSKDQLKLL